MNNSVGNWHDKQRQGYVNNLPTSLSTDFTDTQYISMEYFRR
jgi:hypothetical protein